MPIFQDLYFSTAVKLLLGFVMFIVQIQLTGKGNMAPNTIVDQLQNFVLGGIIGGVIYSTSITVLQFLNVLLIWTLIVVGSKTLAHHFRFWRKLIDGEPVLLIHHGQVLVDNAAKAGITATILADKLRSSGITDVADIDRAILERNGQLTIIQRGDSGLRLPLVLDGQVDEDALTLLGKDRPWLDTELEHLGYTPTDVYMATYTGDHLVVAAYARGVAQPRR